MTRDVFARALVVAACAACAVCAACAAPVKSSVPAEPAPMSETRSAKTSSCASAAIAVSLAPRPCVFAELAREERMIASVTPGISLFVMRVAAPGVRKGAVVFTHGAGSGSSASWDLKHGDYSFMRALACAGFDTYALDARGFGGSTKPPELARDADASPPVVRAKEVIDDVHAAVLYAVKTSSVAQVDLIGWSWGSDVAGMYTSLRPELVRRLVLMSPVYDRRWPARHQTTKAWVAQPRAPLEKVYPAAREEREVWDEFVASLFRFTTGDEVRLPNGPYADIYGEDAPLWDAKKIVSPVLVLRGEADPASTDVNAQNLFRDLAGAKSKRYVVLGNAAHFLHRERAAYREAHATVLSFLELAE
jgi:pimeloyl-ACP methyl ester carboxylesterase